MIRYCLRLIPLLLLAWLLALPVRAAPIDARLQRGVNFQLAAVTAHESEGAGAFAAPAPSDLDIIKSLGFGHLRVRVNPQQLMGGGGRLIKAEADHLLDVIKRIEGAGLATILTMQPPPHYKRALTPGSSAVKDFAAFWKALAGRLGAVGPEWLAFEPLNEPEHESASDWFDVQAALVGAVRTGAPRHRIIAAGHRFSSIPELVETRKLPYDNVMYSFHFYDPHNFTHQGAMWGYPMWEQFTGWPYPSSPSGIQPALAEQTPAARPHLEHYGSQNWNRDKLAAELDRARDWARRNKVDLICTEFGVYRDGGVPEADRQRWLRDVRELLEARDMGWTLWNYAGNFGLVSGGLNERIIDIEAVSALGL